jgi:hypothetical protein
MWLQMNLVVTISGGWEPFWFLEDIVELVQEVIKNSVLLLPDGM